MTTNIFSPLSFVAVFGSGIRDGKNQDPGFRKNIPDPQHCLCSSAGSVVAGSTAAAAGSTGASAGGAAMTAGVSAFPVGWIVLGAALDPAGFLTANPSSERKYTFDCWKQVVHDESITPSNGMLIRDVMLHPSIKAVHIVAGPPTAYASDYPELLIENVWDEKFQIQYVTLDNGSLAAHALRIDGKPVTQ
jgi:hypothetical protein